MKIEFLAIPVLRVSKPAVFMYECNEITIKKKFEVLTAVMTDITHFGAV
jgi:hypothetical protein